MKKYCEKLDDVSIIQRLQKQKNYSPASAVESKTINAL